MDENKKEIEIINGDGSNLDISDVYDHLNSGKPKCNDEKPKSNKDHKPEHLNKKSEDKK